MKKNRNDDACFSFLYTNNTPPTKRKTRNAEESNPARQKGSPSNTLIYKYVLTGEFGTRPARRDDKSVSVAVSSRIVRMGVLGHGG